MDVVDPVLKECASQVALDTMTAFEFLAMDCLEEQRQNMLSMKKVVAEIEYIMSIKEAGMANSD